MLYLVSMAGSLLLCFLLYGVRLRKPQTAILSLLLSIVLGAVMAKLMYVLPMASRQFGSYGLGCLVRFEPEEFSIWGGAVGVCIGTALAAAIGGLDVRKTMDTFAPYGALLLALARGCEYFLGNAFLHRGVIGLGDWIEDGSWACFFPLAVTDQYGMWYYAVFMLEAVAALIAELLAVTAFRRFTFMRTAYFIMAVQLFTEMLHSQTISWSFVRVEQVYCAVAMLVLLFLHCRHAVELKGAFRPCLGFLCLVPVVVYLEFELDKSWLSGLLESTGLDFCYTLASWDAVFCYAVLGVIIVLMLLLERRAVKNRA